MPERLAHIRHWVFDLDNTLYPTSAGVFGQIEVLMNNYIMDHLDIPLDQAAHLRHNYWQTYGTTLNGLIIEHNIDPHHYLEKVHDIDLTHMKPDQTMRDALEELPGEKIIFTNGSQEHAKHVLKARGFDTVFTKIFAIEDSNFIPKPQQKAFDAFLEKLKLNPLEAVMFEDEVRNLKVPKSMGMHTVLVGANDTEDHVDIHVQEIEPLLIDLQNLTKSSSLS